MHTNLIYLYLEGISCSTLCIYATFQNSMEKIQSYFIWLICLPHPLRVCNSPLGRLWSNCAKDRLEWHKQAGTCSCIKFRGAGKELMETAYFKWAGLVGQRISWTKFAGPWIATGQLNSGSCARKWAQMSKPSPALLGALLKDPHIGLEPNMPLAPYDFLPGSLEHQRTT